MSNIDFSTWCKVCKKGVDSFSQSTRFILVADEAIKERESVTLSCGCAIDFPEWDIDLQTGICKISNFAGQVYLEFLDTELIDEGDDEE
jgi:hypothetical protein